MNESILSNLIDTKIVGNKLVVIKEVGSTNEQLKVYAEQGYEDGSVLIAGKQTEGKGRLSRSWFSPEGLNIYLSVIFKPEISPENSAVFTFIASLALTDTLEKLNFIPAIKWPNDILINNKKVSGVLTEMKCKNGKKPDFLVVGIGLNVNMEEDLIVKNLSDVAHKVTSLMIESGQRFRLEEIAAKLINSLDRYYIKFYVDGIDSIVAEWAVKWGKINESIVIDIDGKSYSGIARKVDANGFIYIEDENGMLNKIITGDLVFDS